MEYKLSTPRGYNSNKYIFEEKFYFSIIYRFQKREHSSISEIGKTRAGETDCDANNAKRSKGDSKQSLVTAINSLVVVLLPYMDYIGIYIYLYMWPV